MYKQTRVFEMTHIQDTEYMYYNCYSTGINLFHTALFCLWLCMVRCRNKL